MITLKSDIRMSLPSQLYPLTSEILMSSACGVLLLVKSSCITFSPPIIHTIKTFELVTKII